MNLRLSLICISLIAFSVSCTSSDPEILAASDSWAVYQGPGSNQSTTLSSITPENVHQLTVAWTYRSGDVAEYSQIQCNPLIVNGKVFASTPSLDAVCLDAATGEEIWRTSPASMMAAEEIPSFGMGVNRGLIYASSSAGDRIFISAGPYLFCLNAVSGQPIQSFGNSGRIDLRAGLREGSESAFVVANSPGVVADSLLIIGCRVSEALGAAPGDIRAFDIHSGELVWTFHTIPHPGEFGHDTWPEEAWTTAGGANAWAGMTVDHERNLVFVPTGSASYDFYGGDRPGANLFANTLLALDTRTGKRVWHFQFVHHDLLDRDLPAPPNLITIQRDGKAIPAVAQITKTGHVFVFHRETGEPLFPIEEVPVPASDMVGEQSWPTQPLPTTLPPFSRQSVGGIFEQANGRDSLEALLTSLRQESIFQPPSESGTLVFPGYDGGGEWGGAAFDPWRGYMLFNASQMAWSLHMVPTMSDHPGASVYLANCASCHGADRRGGEFMGNIPSLVDLGDRMDAEAIRSVLENGQGNMPAFGFLNEADLQSVTRFLLDLDSEEASESAKSAFVSTGYHRLLDRDGYPAIQPPWGILTAMDMNSGEIVWQVPLGEYEELSAKGIAPTGTENYGGPLVTASGLTFIAATKDEKIRAFNTESGKLLWEAKLPAGGYATPSMYAVGGVQYLVIACGGGKMGTPSGDAYVAFRLP